MHVLSHTHTTTHTSTHTHIRPHILIQKYSRLKRNPKGLCTLIRNFKVKFFGQNLFDFFDFSEISLFLPKDCCGMTHMKPVVADKNQCYLIYIKTKIYLFTYLLLSFLFYSLRVSWWSFTEVWVTASLLKSPAKSTFLKVLFFLLITIRSGLLAKIRWSVCMLKSQKSLCVSFSMTDAGLCIYHLFVWSNLNF